MAYTYQVRGERQLKTTYEVYIETFDGLSSMGPLVVHFPKKPSTKFRDSECARRTAQHETKLKNPDEELKIYPPEEVTEILREKGYLKIDEEFSEDMPDKVGP